MSTLQHRLLDLAAIRARAAGTVTSPLRQGRRDTPANEDALALLAYVHDLEQELAENDRLQADLAYREVMLKRAHGALADAGCVVPIELDKTIEHAIRALAERALTAEERLEQMAKERDEARAKCEMLYEEADRALRAPLLALSAIVGGDAFFAPGPWDSQTQGINALAERITRSFAIWRDRAAKQSAEDFKRGAEAMREACQQWCRAWEDDGNAIADALVDLRVEDEP